MRVRDPTNLMFAHSFPDLVSDAIKQTLVVIVVHEGRYEASEEASLYRLHRCWRGDWFELERCREIGLEEGLEDFVREDHHPETMEFSLSVRFYGYMC